MMSYRGKSITTRMLLYDTEVFEDRRGLMGYKDSVLRSGLTYNERQHTARQNAIRKFIGNLVSSGEVPWYTAEVKRTRISRTSSYAHSRPNKRLPIVTSG